MQDPNNLLITIFSVPTVIFVVGGVIAIIAILAGTITGAMVKRSREQTRREIAAYVASGTLDPDKAVALLNAGRSPSESDLTL